ncbi:hypothetical protein ACFQ0G_10535 [Streptomyces chiangmaiensis]
MRATAFAFTTTFSRWVAAGGSLWCCWLGEVGGAVAELARQLAGLLGVPGRGWGGR